MFVLISSACWTWSNCSTYSKHSAHENQETRVVFAQLRLWKSSQLISWTVCPNSSPHARHDYDYFEAQTLSHTWATIERLDSTVVLVLFASFCSVFWFYVHKRLSPHHSFCHRWIIDASQPSRILTQYGEHRRVGCLLYVFIGHCCPDWGSALCIHM